MRAVNWMPFISQTGSEVMTLCENHKVLPHTLVTNNLDRIGREVESYMRYHRIPIIVLPEKPSIDDYLDLPFYLTDIITLNGYLRILPKEFIERHRYIYNGHPGLITRYPELKGLDPQKQLRILAGRFTSYGSVIHEVVPEVDGGRIIIVSERKMTDDLAKEIASDSDRVFTLLRETSLETWNIFFKIKQWDNGN